MRIARIILLVNKLSQDAIKNINQVRLTAMQTAQKFFWFFIEMKDFISKAMKKIKMMPEKIISMEFI